MFCNLRANPISTHDLAGSLTGTDEGTLNPSPCVAAAVVEAGRAAPVKRDVMDGAIVLGDAAAVIEVVVGAAVA